MSRQWYTAYRLADGEIVRTFTSSSDVLAGNIPPGCAVISGLHDAWAYFVNKGEAAPYTDAQRLSKLVRPEFPAAWSNKTMAWVDTRSEQERIAQQWAKVRAERDALLVKTDWVAIKQAEVGGPLEKPWRDYRQALRDITLQADPFSLVWPTPP